MVTKKLKNMAAYVRMCTQLVLYAAPTEEAISVKPSFAAWFLAPLSQQALGLLFVVFTFFTNLSRENPIVPNDSHTVSLPFSYPGKCLLSICGN